MPSSASAHRRGGPLVLRQILSRLPANFPWPVVCIQHISPGFLAGLVSWLDTACALPVCVPRPGDKPQAGQIYFAPEGQHLVLDGSGSWQYASGAPVSGHRPSVTQTFNAIARFYGSRTIGVLLSGMGEDGAEGLQTIDAVGGLTFAQNAETCVVYGMPKVAIEQGCVHHVLPPEAIAEHLITLARSSVCRA